jgi:hypothetical protein
MSSALGIFLQNHEAAARAGIDLCRRAAHNQRETAHGAELTELCEAINGDRDRLLMIMRSQQVRPNPLMGVALQLAERVGRLKPNGHVLRRSPLSDLIEIEGLLDAVGAKRVGWYALAAASPRVPLTSQVSELITRADDQLRRLRMIHTTVAARVLT